MAADRTSSVAGTALSLKTSRRRLARIRCLKDCIDSFRNNQSLPQTLCYIPAQSEFKACRRSKLTVYDEPKTQANKILSLSLDAGSRVRVRGEELFNSEGQWGYIKQLVTADGSVIFKECEDKEAWLLLYSSQAASTSSEDKPVFLPITEPSLSRKEQVYGKKPKPLNSWEEIVENAYALHLNSKNSVEPADTDAVERLCQVPTNWSLDHDENLTQFLGSHMETDNENLGSIKNYVESIDVSTYSEEEGAENLTDGDPETYWESDGNQGQHWIRLHMKKATIIHKLVVTVDANDDNYMPYRMQVMGGQIDSLKKLNEITVDQSVYGIHDVTVLEDQKDHYPVIEIKIKECKDDGIDTRIHLVKIRSSKERELGLNKELFTKNSMVRFPKLENFDCRVLYDRAVVLQRFISLLDSVLPYLVPAWEYSIGSCTSLEIVRQLLPLSKKRMSLIETFLRESETSRPSRMPKLYINRRLAAEHRSDPQADPECKNTVFNQVYEGLKPRDRSEIPLDYRWPSRYDQWWECKFIAEGIIDQGGGFRDSLADLADELCPSLNDSVVPLPYFIRPPNQNNIDSNVNRDVYVPNPSCKDVHKYEWIGKLMGACLRGKESLVLNLPAFIWKKLAGERVTWSRDYVTVDEAEVKMIENMEIMDEESFNTYFSDERTWTAVLSDGTVVPLKPEGHDLLVAYGDRHEYCRLVQETRLAESDLQIKAMRQGLLYVVPEAVLDLLTWQELERRICGNPDITMEALRRSTHYEDLEEDDSRVKYMWEALENFSNEDRSRFLRFVTGRRRLPAPLYICNDKGEMADALPESSTCSNTLYLPNYSSAKTAEEKLRYAAYNCIAIDTDMSPWDE